MKNEIYLILDDNSVYKIDSFQFEIFSLNGIFNREVRSSIKTNDLNLIELFNSFKKQNMVLISFKKQVMYLDYIINLHGVIPLSLEDNKVELMIDYYEYGKNEYWVNFMKQYFRDSILDKILDI